MVMTRSYALLLCTALLLWAAALAAADEPKRALVLGGTQFMGRLTVEKLLEPDSGYDEVAMLNRGHSKLSPVLADAVANRRLAHLLCDRMDERDKFVRLLRERGPWTLIVDFIGFERRFTEDAISALALDGGGYGNLHYVHISTDSVYQVMPLPTDGYAPLDEGCCRRAADEEAHAAVAGRTREGRYQLGYGGNKLSCDEALAEAWAASGFPYTSLRLPDVYGPWDNQGGMWEEFVAPTLGGEAVAAFLPEERMRSRGSPPDWRTWEMSWLYAPDLARAVLAVARAGERVHGAVLHVAHAETATIAETARLVAAAAGVDAIPVDGTRTSRTPQHDPGPISVERALSALDWRPTPLADGIKQAVAWYRASEEHRDYAAAVARRDDEPAAPSWVPLCARACLSCETYETTDCGATCRDEDTVDLRARCRDEKEEDAAKERYHSPEKKAERAAARAERAELAAAAAPAQAAFLADRAAEAGVVVRESGLMYKILRAGAGARRPSPEEPWRVSVDYEGALIDGTRFERGEAYEPSSAVIRGWREALPLMVEGDRWELYVPAGLAYGDRGAAPDILPGATLVFVLELLEIRGKSLPAAGSAGAEL